MRSHLLTSFKVLLVLTFVLGIIYPVSMTLFAQSFFSKKANGSLVEINGQIVGSTLLAQKFVSQRYFWSRPSASDYGAVPSGASNLGSTSKVLKQAIIERKSKGQVPDLLFSSASGLDPHISFDAALSQVPRIVESRQLNESDKKRIIQLIRQSEEPRDFGIFGEKRINVLLLNIEIDKIFSS